MAHSGNVVDDVDWRDGCYYHRNRRFLRDAKEDLRDEVRRMRAADIEELSVMAEAFRDGLEVLQKHLEPEVEDDGEGVIVDGVWQPYDDQYPREGGC